MSGVSSLGVSDFANTTLTYAPRVVADGRVSGTGVVCLYSNVPPVTIDYLITQDNLIITTQSGDRIYIDFILSANTITTQNGDILQTQDNNTLIT